MRNSADDVRMTYVPADDMWMTYMPVDDVQMRFVSPDNMRMMCRRHSDDTRCSTAWNWATQASVQMMCRRHPDNICHLPVKSHPESHSRVIRTSSAWDGLQTTCRRRAHMQTTFLMTFLMTYVKSPTNSHSHVVCTSSARDFSSQTISS